MHVLTEVVQEAEGGEGIFDVGVEPHYRQRLLLGAGEAWGFVVCWLSEEWKKGIVTDTSKRTSVAYVHRALTLGVAHEGQVGRICTPHDRQFNALPSMRLSSSRGRRQ